MKSLLAALLLFALAAGAADDLLEPEKAFRMSARALDPTRVEVRFAIADGYYMYREKFLFALEGAGDSRLGQPEFPSGTKKTDAFFGEVETYRKEVAIRIPVEGTAPTLQLVVTSQGCADIGVCYVPMDRKATVQLAGYSSAPHAGDGTELSTERAGGLSLPSSDVDVAAMFQSGGFWVVLASFLGFGLLLSFTPCVLPMVPILSGIIVGERAAPGKRHAFLL